MGRTELKDENGTERPEKDRKKETEIGEHEQTKRKLNEEDEEEKQ